MHNLIERANSIPLWKILKMPEPSRDIQLRCPFSERHEHGDTHRSARYYLDTNKIYCFTESKLWSPVDLFVEKTGRPANQIASMLIKKYGDRVEDRAEKLKNQIAKVEQKSTRADLYLDLEDSFKEPSVRRFVAERREIEEECGANLFKDTAETATKLVTFIAETRKEKNDGQKCDHK